jgi:hypothetical protein
MVLGWLPRFGFGWLLLWSWVCYCGYGVWIVAAVMVMGDKGRVGASAVILLLIAAVALFGRLLRSWCWVVSGWVLRLFCLAAAKCLLRPRYWAVEAVKS